MSESKSNIYMIAYPRLLLLALLPVSGLFAQAGQDLPRYFTEAEKIQLLSGKFTPAIPEGRGDPPALPVRAMGEWEELQAILVTWQTNSNNIRNILTEIIRAAREECRVVVCCSNTATVTGAQNYLLGKSVDISSNVDFLVVPNNSIWIRDYGPNCVYANNVDSLYFVDWRYNRVTRPLDDTLATTVAKFLQIPLYSTNMAPSDLVHTGGNFMSDGWHNAFSSRLILDENAPGNPYGVSVKSEAQIDAIMAGYMGIQRYAKMTPLPYDGIHHIDMHMKLLDEETLLVGEYPVGIADGPQIEANIQYVLSNFQSVFGTSYKIIRIPMPPENSLYPNNGGDYRTYSNAVFVNKMVLVPFYEQKFDTTARRIWEEALPGYTIVGIDCNAIIPSLGAIHCITKEVGVPDPLRIVHQKLPCMDNTAYSNYPIWATLQHRSGIASAKIYYTTNPDGPWQSVDLPVYPLDDTIWTHKGFIPQQPPGSTVYYYLEGTAENGKTVRRPLPAPEGYWSFCSFVSVSAFEEQIVELNNIYPNPATAITVVPVNISAVESGSLRLFNAIGQQVHTLHEGPFPAGTTNYFMDAARFPAGTYWVELRAGNQTRVQKLLIR
ncbi:MAG: agmatine deiminase family protein [Saprospirales bacterium]|nr:agmatine deiminase family protein [Saprospirales bacterium]